MPCFVQIEFSPVILHVSFRLKRFCHFIHSFIYIYVWWTIFRCRRHVPFQRWLLISIATISFNRWFFYFYFYFSFRSFSIMFLIHFFFNVTAVVDIVVRSRVPRYISSPDVSLCLVLLFVCLFLTFTVKNNTNWDRKWERRRSHVSSSSLTSKKNN